MSSHPVGHDGRTTRDGAAASKSVVAEDTDLSTLDYQLKEGLIDVLDLDRDDALALTVDSGVFGHLPELDSMAVAGLLTEIEDRLDIVIDDDEVDGEMLETYGSLLSFIEPKSAEARA